MHSQQHKLIMQHLWHPVFILHISPTWSTDAGIQRHLCCPCWLSHMMLNSVMPGNTSIKLTVPFTLSVCMLWVALALLRVVLSTWPCPQLFWRWGDEKKTRVTLRHLFVVVHVSPLSLPHWGASVVRVGSLMLWPGWLVPEPASRAVLVSGWTVTPASASGVATSVSSPVCGADAWHVGPLGHYLQAKEQ